MRILFLPMIGTRGIGTLTRLLAISDEARAMGHQTAFIARHAPLRWLGAHGSHVYEADEPPAHLGPDPDICLLPDTALVRGLANKEYLRGAIETQIRVIDEFKPDVIVSEYNFVARISSARRGVPLVSLCTWADHPDYAASKGLISPNTDRVNDIYNELLEEYQQPPIIDLCEMHFLRSDLKIVPSAPSLEPQFTQVPGAQYVGHLVWPALEEGPLPPEFTTWALMRPLIYVYFSVTDIDPQRYAEVLPQAFDGTAYNVAVIVGRHPRVTRPPADSSNVHFYSRLPGLSVMRHCFLAIHHAGGNVSIASILAGLPALVFPDRDFERQFHAENLERLGVAQICSIDRFHPLDVLAEAEKVVSDITMRARVRTVREEIEHLGGPNRAVRLLEQLA